jgi:carbonic anhydrase
LKNLAIGRLVEGNKRLVANKSEIDISESKRIKVAYKQKPYGIIIGCSDSRVSPEIIFDQGLGDLFVIRTAGLVLDHSSIGTIEFGLRTFQCPIIVILGHTNCGAIKYVLEAMQDTNTEPTNFQYLLNAIKPSINQSSIKGKEKMDNAIINHIKALAKQLERSTIISKAIREGKLEIVLGFYNIETGIVEFLQQ